MEEEARQVHFQFGIVITEDVAPELENWFRENIPSGWLDGWANLYPEVKWFITPEQVGVEYIPCPMETEQHAH